MSEGTTERDVWAYVAHKDGKFAGCITGAYGDEHHPSTPEQERRWKKDIAKFCGDFIVDGFDITKVYDRSEYDALTKGMPMWKRPEKVKEPDLFNQEASP